MSLYPGYVADPFVLRTGDGFVAYGTDPHRSHDDGREFVVLSSDDLLTWRSHGGALERADPALGTDYWAPEVAHADGRWWMFYSVGHDIAGHHLRVAVADDPLGPFADLGVNLTPDERFAIDPHPFVDADGRWYLFFARDVIDAARAGTHLAVAALESMTRLGPVTEVLQPFADWQIYERSREMYGAVHDWHTLEGPSVVRRRDRYWLTYSGGAWTGDSYAVSWAVADSPLGPWRPAPASAVPLLRTADDLIGPGHNSLTVDRQGNDVIVFHSWNAARTRREMHARRIDFAEDGPHVGDPIGVIGARSDLPDGAEVLARAHEHALEWLAALPERAVPPVASVADVSAALGSDLPDGPTSPTEVIDLLAESAEPGLTAMPSGRFFGFVIGGAHPAALAADWLTSAWDQNAGLRTVTPAATAVDDIAERWVLDLLGLPEESAAGFVTGGTMANFTCLAAARDAVLARAGWDVGVRGLVGSPGVRVLVGAERHDSVDLVLRYLGLGAPELVGVDAQGRLDSEELRRMLESGDDLPTVVALQAGNIHSGAFDPFQEAIGLAHEHGAWVHVDGAFGLFAGATGAYRHLVHGYEAADSWATDAHKTLNVPYDCGLAIVRDPTALRAAMSMHGDYLIHDAAGDPFEKVPELSRRARAFPVWAVLRSLGRSGVAELVERLAGHARAFADGIAAIEGAEVLNDVVFTQVCATFGDDARTLDVVRRMMEDGTAWASGSVWHDRAVLRVSVSNWSTTDADVRRTLDALRTAVAAS